MNSSAGNSASHRQPLLDIFDPQVMAANSANDERMGEVEHQQAQSSDLSSLNRSMTSSQEEQKLYGVFSGLQVITMHKTGDLIPNGVSLHATPNHSNSYTKTHSSAVPSAGRKRSV